MYCMRGCVLGCAREGGHESDACLDDVHDFEKSSCAHVLCTRMCASATVSVQCARMMNVQGTEVDLWVLHRPICRGCVMIVGCRVTNVWGEKESPCWLAEE